MQLENLSPDHLRSCKREILKNIFNKYIKQGIILVKVTMTISQYSVFDSDSEVLKSAQYQNQALC